MHELVKVCPDCNAEYLPHIERCADCGAVLILPGQPAPASASPPPEGRVQVRDDLVCVRVADLDWARRLGARLERAGIDHLMETEQTAGATCCGSGRFRVMVRRTDAEAAVQVDGEQLRREVPEMDQLPQSSLNAEACPACGNPVSESAAECPSCGLAIMPVMAACAGCGAPLPPDAQRCPGCGRATGGGCC